MARIKQTYTQEDLDFAASIGVTRLDPTAVYAARIKSHIVNSVASARREGYVGTVEILELAGREFVAKLDALCAPAEAE